MATAARWAPEPVVLDHIHRFVRTGADATGMAVTEADVAYAELSLVMRDARGPAEVAARLVERGAVVAHPSRDAALDALAPEVAAAAGRPGALAVTVATNADALDLSTAVRAIRIAEGSVDDARTVAGMEGVRIGAGDRIVTRRNDALIGVSNRQSWTVEAVGADGAISAREGDQRVVLEPAYVATAAQLGYATTDYGNQGVTTERSLTWVGEATSAAGLYVGATRGRYANTVHVVADGLDDARAEIVAALGRDRTDRGLSAGRALAEAGAAPVPQVAPSRPLAMPRLPIDPATWRTEAELDAAARVAEEPRRLTPLREVMGDDERGAADAADRAAAEAERERARGHRAAAERARARRDELVAPATADLLAARDDARTIQRGPGRLGRRAARVAEAQAHQAEVRRRWATPSVPGDLWPDALVRREAVEAAASVAGAAAAPHIAAAEQAERVAHGHDHAIAERGEAQAAARHATARRAAELTDHRAGVERTLAAVAVERAARRERVAAMSPAEVTAADRAREAFVAAQARQRQMAHQQHAMRHPIVERGRGPEVEGPSIGF